MGVGPRPPSVNLKAPDDPNMLRAMANQMIQQATLLRDNARVLRECADRMDGRSDD
jgi:hypothetical protein